MEMLKPSSAKVAPKFLTSMQLKRFLKTSLVLVFLSNSLKSKAYLSLSKFGASSPSLFCFKDFTYSTFSPPFSHIFFMGNLSALSLPKISPFPVLFGRPVKSAFQFDIKALMPITP